MNQLKKKKQLFIYLVLSRKELHQQEDQQMHGFFVSFFQIHNSVGVPW